MKKANGNSIRYLAIISLIGFALIVFAQMPESDPIASQMVRSESMNRTMEDMQIKQDIKLRDNQTANAINEFKGENNSRLEKSIAEMKRVYELLNSTYNDARKVGDMYEAQEFYRRQQETSNNILRLLGSLSFSKEMINPQMMNDVIQTLVQARERNKEAIEIFKSATKSDNHMTTGERSLQIKEAIMRNGDALRLVEQSLQRMHMYDVRNQQQEDLKKLISVINLY